MVRHLIQEVRILIVFGSRGVRAYCHISSRERMVVSHPPHETKSTRPVLAGEDRPILTFLNLVVSTGQCLLEHSFTVVTRRQDLV